MDKKTKNHGKSIRAKLLNVAKEEGVFYQTVLTRYFQERLLYRFSQTRYRVNFYLKGGALMFAYDRFAARPTFDVDFLGCNISNESSSVISAFKEICSFPCDEDGVTFDVEQITSQIITEFKDYHGIRLTIPVKMDTISQVMTMDIGFGDVVTPSSISIDYPVMLSNLPGVNIQAYSIENVIAEILNDIDVYEKASRELAGYEQTENGQRGKVITSISSGSESISYSVKETSNSIVGAVLTDKKAQERLFYDIAVEYLSGTGLLYAGF